MQYVFETKKPVELH